MDSIVVTNGRLNPDSTEKEEQTLDGEYFISPPDKLWKGKPFYSRKFEDGTVQGVIFFDNDGRDDSDGDIDIGDDVVVVDEVVVDGDVVVLAGGSYPRWKIHCVSNFYGWCLSERAEDPSLPFPPLGKWKGGSDDCPEANDYQAVFSEGVVFVKPAKRKD